MRNQFLNNAALVLHIDYMESLEIAHSFAICSQLEMACFISSIIDFIFPLNAFGNSIKWDSTGFLYSLILLVCFKVIYSAFFKVMYSAFSKLPIM